MARAVNTAGERRQALRRAPEDTPWSADALLRPGQEVRLVNVSSGGALIESLARIKPGARAELQLSGTTRRLVRGRIDRCRVVAIGPVRYEAAIVFEQALEWA